MQLSTRFLGIKSRKTFQKPNSRTYLHQNGCGKITLISNSVLTDHFVYKASGENGLLQVSAKPTFKVSYMMTDERKITLMILNMTHRKKKLQLK